MQIKTLQDPANAHIFSVITEDPGRFYGTVRQFAGYHGKWNAETHDRLIVSDNGVLWWDTKEEAARALVHYVISRDLPAFNEALKDL